MSDFFLSSIFRFLTLQDSRIDPAVYPHFDIYPSVQGDCVVRSCVSTKFSSTSVVQTQERTLSAFSSVSNTGSSLKAGGIGYPTLNICMHLSFPVIDNIPSPVPNHHNLDPAVYPYIEIYPQIQTVQSRAGVMPGDDGREFKSYLPSGPKVLETQPWAFGWPSYRPDSPLTSTPPFVPDSTPILSQNSVMAYLVIEICEFSVAGKVSQLFANHGALRSRCPSLLRHVPDTGKARLCSTSETSPTANVFGHLREAYGNETGLPGDNNL